MRFRITYLKIFVVDTVFVFGAVRSYKSNIQLGPATFSVNCRNA